jgi:hypothetical protein
MALTDKNIVITPNTGSDAEPEMVFSGADASNTAKNITAKIYPTNGGTLSFEGSSGQLFSIVNSMTGAIYSVNDVSGIPSIEVLDTGIVKLAQYSGNVLLGTAIDDGVSKLQVNGTLDASTVTTRALEVVGGVSVIGSNGIRQQVSVGSSGYGTFWRQDGSNLYLMVTDNNNATGSWNSYRPFTLGLASGVVTLVNPILSGIASTPTASLGTNTSQVATTAYVQAELTADLATATPSALGTAAVGSSLKRARENHVHAMPTLDSLTNITITSNTAGEILEWSGSAWINQTLAEANIASVTQLNLKANLSSPVLLSPTLNNGYTEQVSFVAGTSGSATVSGGSIKTWALTGNSTVTDSLQTGQSLTLMIDDGSGYLITWPGVVWKTDGGAAPYLNTSGYTAVVLWKVSNILYGARVGDN